MLHRHRWFFLAIAMMIPAAACGGATDDAIPPNGSATDGDATTGADGSSGDGDGASSNEDASSNDASSDASASASDTGNDANGSTEAAADAGVCNSIANNGQPVSAVESAAAMPAATGGTIADGTYDLVGWTYFTTVDAGGGPPPTNSDGGVNTLEEVFVFSASDGGTGALQLVLAQNGERDQRVDATLAFTGTAFDFTQACGNVGNLHLGYSVAGTGSGSSLLLYLGASEFTFKKR
jgi:hypothetical protein